jgi:hypothetical protein
VIFWNDTRDIHCKQAVAPASQRNALSAVLSFRLLLLSWFQFSNVYGDYDIVCSYGIGCIGCMPCFNKKEEGKEEAKRGAEDDDDDKDDNNKDDDDDDDQYTTVMFAAVAATINKFSQLLI